MSNSHDPTAPEPVIHTAEIHDVTGHVPAHFEATLAERLLRRREYRARLRTAETTGLAVIILSAGAAVAVMLVRAAWLFWAWHP